MIKIPKGFPVPSRALQAKSERLNELILKKIQENPKNSISFAHFMELALYAPNQGYYTAGLDKFGRKGDFITAPEISPLFAYCLGKQCQEIFHNLKGPLEILEIGAGTGQLAIDLLLFLEQEGGLPNRYSIFEISSVLRERQKKKLQQYAPHLFSRVHWIKDWPVAPIQGVIIANEVLDAFPVSQFRWIDDSIHEVRVSYVGGRLAYTLTDPSRRQKEELFSLKKKYFPKSFYYQSEVCGRLEGWLQRLNESLEKGLALIIDYGFTASSYYHPGRNHGTLMCYYRHRAHTDPFKLVGLQDITAFVDFSRIKNVVRQIGSGLQLAGFTSQAVFLMNNGLLDLVQKCYNKDSEDSLSISRQVHYLTSPTEMGELVKVLGLTRGYEKPPRLQGFLYRDRSPSL